jgi:hypothetical protein
MAKKTGMLKAPSGKASSQLGSYKNVIGKNTKGKATKAVGLVKASKSKKGI